MIGYSQVHFAVWHLDSRTTFAIKTLISFEYMYSLIPIQRTYILMNIVEATKPGVGKEILNFTLI